MAVMSTTNEISKQIGVSKRTLQYYDDEGLLSLERTEQNHRVYDQNTLQQVWEILIYKEMGFGLQEIKVLTHLSEEERKERLQEQIEKLNVELQNLNIRKKLLDKALNTGFPELPDTDGEQTYVEYISTMKKNMITDVSKDFR